MSLWTLASWQPPPLRSDWTLTYYLPFPNIKGILKRNYYLDRLQLSLKEYFQVIYKNTIKLEIVKPILYS